MTGNTLLFIEDDIPLREYYSLSLESHHYRVIQADNSKNILPLIEQYHPDLIITDLVMQDHDGLEGIFKLIGKYNIPVMVLSAYPEFIQLAKPVVTATYVKPLTAEQLRQAVEKILGSPPPQASPG